MGATNHLAQNKKLAAEIGIVQGKTSVVLHFLKNKATFAVLFKGLGV
jgi:hypothetical protein